MRIVSMIFLISFVIFGLAMSAQTSFAQGEHEGACRADAEKLCKDVNRGGGAMLKCMKDNEAQLSADCKAQIAKRREQFKERAKERIKDAHDDCKTDIEKFCKDVKPGRGRVVECLKKNEAQLSAECKAHSRKAGARGRPVGTR